ncbi:MAG: hypothetical protein RIS29_3148 [Bacteroidota bacterium]|jgi:uncharacterized protein YunC (DUF1805 family)
MKLPENVVLLDSLGDIHTDNIYPILVCGSHCGDNGTFARKLKNCAVQAVFLNNAGIGKNNAGISGLGFYDAANIMACAVSHNSAEIGVSADTWENGIITHLSLQAEAAGIQIGDSVQEAVAKINPILKPCTPSASVADDITGNSKAELTKQKQTQLNGVAITIADSITFLNADNAGDILVCGSHGGVSAGHYAEKLQLKAAFFNDAGIGKNNAGIKSLDSLSDLGILACTVDCMSAEIFNAEDALENGIISVCNQLAKDKNIREKMTVKEALMLI